MNSKSASTSEVGETQKDKDKDTNTPVTSEQERELAQNALLEFQKGSYAACLDRINKLETLRPKDLKVTHNKVIVEYYKHDLRKTEFVKKSLNAICGQTSTSESTSIDDIERCIMQYNQAVVLYHTKQYTAALDIMTRLFCFIEPMEDTLARKVCLLFVELQIKAGRYDTALALVNYLETQFIYTENTKILTADKDGTAKIAKELKERKKNSGDTASDAFKIKLLKYKVRILMVLRELKLCRKEFKTLLSSGLSMDLQTMVLKARHERTKGNFKKGIKLLNLLKTQTLDFKDCGENLAVLYYNNIACLHFAMGKSNLACYYLRESLSENKIAVESVRTKDNEPLSSQPLYTLGGDKHHELLYNLGVASLYAGQPSQAFDCFAEVVQSFHKSPIFWLRMAEACILCHKLNNEMDFNIQKRKKDIVRKVVGSGVHKKIIMSSSFSRPLKYQPQDRYCTTPRSTLEYASQCLKTALFLLPGENDIQNIPINTVENTQMMSLSLTSDQNLICQNVPTLSRTTINERWNLKISIIAATAYVSLCLGDYNVALEQAKILLSTDRLPGAFGMLANLYAAESLIFLDKIDEAIEYLKLENIQDLNTYSSDKESNEKENNKVDEAMLRPVHKWFPNSKPTAVAVFRYNLAVAYAIRGELCKSSETLKQVWMSRGPNCDVPIQVIMLALYIELQLGNAEVSKSIIKQHCPQYR